MKQPTGRMNSSSSTVTERLYGLVLLALAMMTFIIFAFLDAEGKVGEDSAVLLSLRGRHSKGSVDHDQVKRQQSEHDAQHNSSRRGLEQVLATEMHLMSGSLIEEKEQLAYSLNDILNVENGAWILPKNRLPKAKRTDTADEFNERLVGAIIDELSKAWPPRVSSSFAIPLAQKAYGLDIERRRDQVVDKGEGNYSKVAFLFLVKGPVPTEPLWRAFFAHDFARKRSSIFVHPPIGFTFEEGSFFQPYALPHKSRVRTSWGGLGLVHAEIVMLVHALRDPLNARFVLLSETDVPLWPFKCTHDALLSRPDLSFVGSKRTLERFDMFDFGRRSVEYATAWRKGSQWFAISREHAEAVTSRSDIQAWYDAHARKQLSRIKVQRMGPLTRILHIAEKPNFADEHFLQTTLAIKRLEGNVVPFSLTFAAFGRDHELTVWGDGRKYDFKLHAAEWHAIQWGSLSWRALGAWHRLCDYDLDNLGPVDREKLDSVEAKRRLVYMNDSEAVLKEIIRLRSLAPNGQPLFAGNTKDNRTRSRRRPFSSYYTPDRLSCSLKRAKQTHRLTPCFLFARKLHPESVNYYGQLMATYFLAKTNPSLADRLRRVRTVQRAASGAEIAGILANRSPLIGEDYAQTDALALNALIPERFFPAHSGAKNMSGRAHNSTRARR